MNTDGVKRGRQVIESALVVHSGALGDTILMLSLVRALREAGIPRVSVLNRGCYHPLLKMCPDVAECHDIDTGGFHAIFSADATIPDRIIAMLGQFDLIINMLADSAGVARNRIVSIGVPYVVDINPIPRSSMDRHITRQWLDDLRQALQPKVLKVSGASPQPRLSFTSQSAEAIGVSEFPDSATTFFQAHPILRPNLFAVLHPGSGSRAKCWPLENFISLAKSFNDAKRPCAFLLGPVEQEQMAGEQIVSLEGAAPVFRCDDLLQLAEFLSKAHTIVSNDSGIAHLAAALDRPVVVIFGPTAPRRWRPLGSRVTVMSTPLDWPTTDAVVEAVIC
ncbi:MAG: glycosyltransferase family 9 protein [Planctomycetes bacterium]|nr:glycosyltransferase family 9 protein [Planctomycetota bacterium]